jgi:hypothetical protein
MKKQRYFNKAKLYEGNGAPKSNVLMSGYPAAIPKSGPDYSVFIAK